MPLVIRVESELDAYTEADMRRWWRGKCRKILIGGEILFDVGDPKRLNLYEGVKRFASFGVVARVVRRRLPY